MILADLTETKIQNCVKLGITADFGTESITDGKGHLARGGCHEVQKTAQGLFPFPCLATLISQAYKVIISFTREVICSLELACLFVCLTAG